MAEVQLKELNPVTSYALWQALVPLALLALGLTIAREVTSAGMIVLMVLAMGLLFYKIYFPLHDTSHYALFKSRAVNRIVGQLMAGMLATPFDAFREEHMRHHKHFGTMDDPGAVDYFVRFNSKRELIGFLLKPLLGANLWHKLGDYYKTLRAKKEATEVLRLERSLSGHAWVVGVQLALLVYLTHGLALSELWRYPVFVLVPGATVFLFLSRLRMFLEHGSLDYQKFDYLSNPRPTSRTIISRRVEKWIMSGANFNYHHEHHRYPGISSYHLPRLHALLIEKDFDPEDARPTYITAFRELWKTL